MKAHNLTITPTALDYIKNIGQEKFKDAYVLVLADLHAIGGIIVPEIEPIEQMWGNDHFQEIFPRNYKSYPFPVYIDFQMEREGYLPQNMVIDFARTHEGMRLVFKNPDFEE
ncbi:MAG: hypothetical protein ACTSVZ_12380 [Promethearchaeota archaeon]